MRPTTIRLSDETLAALEHEAIEYEFENRTEYIRHIIEHRDVVREHTQSYSDENTDGADYERLRSRLADIESRLDALESTSTDGRRESGSERTETVETVETVETREIERDATIERLLDGFGPGRNQDERDERLEIAHTALEWLRDRPVAVQRSDFVTALYETTSLDGQGESAWWRRVVRPAIAHAADQGAVDTSGRSYEWIGAE